LSHRPLILWPLFINLHGERRLFPKVATLGSFRRPDVHVWRAGLVTTSAYRDIYALISFESLSSSLASDRVLGVLTLVRVTAVVLGRAVERGMFFGCIVWAFSHFVASLADVFEWIEFYRESLPVVNLFFLFLVIVFHLDLVTDLDHQRSVRASVSPYSVEHESTHTTFH
jgi:hypothetical protein